MIARLTEKGQVTIPKEIRKFLGVSYGDTIDFILSNKSVYIEKEEPTIDARRLREILPTRRQYHPSYIKKAKNIALSGKWKKK